MYTAHCLLLLVSKQRDPKRIVCCTFFSQKITLWKKFIAMILMDFGSSQAHITFLVLTLTRF